MPFAGCRVVGVACASGSFVVKRWNIARIGWRPFAFPLPFDGMLKKQIKNFHPSMRVTNFLFHFTTSMVAHEDSRGLQPGAGGRA